MSTYAQAAEVLWFLDEPLDFYVTESPYIAMGWYDCLPSGQFYFVDVVAVWGGYDWPAWE